MRADKSMTTLVSVINFSSAESLSPILSYNSSVLHVFPLWPSGITSMGIWVGKRREAFGQRSFNSSDSLVANKRTLSRLERRAVHSPEKGRNWGPFGNCYSVASWTICLGYTLGHSIPNKFWLSNFRERNFKLFILGHMSIPLISKWHFYNQQLQTIWNFSRRKKQKNKCTDFP